MAQFFKTLSEPVRLRLIWLLGGCDECCVCHIVDALALPQSVVSRHLAYLRQHNLVSARRSGAWMHYRLSPQSPFEQAVVAQVLAVASDQAEVDRVRLNKAVSACA